MITEAQFQEALQVIKDYQKQVDQLVKDAMPKRALKRGDMIVFTKVNSQNRTIVIGKEYRVVNCSLHPLTKSDKDRFYDAVKYKGDPYQAIIDENIPHYTIIQIDLGACKYRTVHSTAGYEYELRSQS